MTPAEHYLFAERILAEIERSKSLAEAVAAKASVAQVHATLALSPYGRSPGGGTP